MTSCRANDLRKFKKCGIFPYFVKYLGRGPENDEVPDFVLERRNPIPGKLSFSLGKVSFFCEDDVSNDPFGDFTHNSSIEDGYFEESVNFIYLIGQIEKEKMCDEGKILCITLLSSDEKRMIYFDVADPKNESCTVYYPQWVEVAKNHNETQPGLFQNESQPETPQNELNKFAQDIIDKYDSCVVM